MVTHRWSLREQRRYLQNPNETSEQVTPIQGKPSPGNARVWYRSRVWTSGMLPYEVSGGSASAADRASDEPDETPSVDELRVKTNHSLLLLTKMRKHDLEKVGDEMDSLVF